MKPVTSKSFLKKITLASTTAIVIFVFNSCATKINFMNSSVVPAAQGTVKVKRDNNKNYEIKIDLKNLADPGRLQPSKHSYVVWMDSGENISKNIGQINTSSGFLSSKLKAAFETVSPIKPSRIFITAEDDATVQYPGEQVVLTTQNF